MSSPVPGSSKYGKTGVFLSEPQEIWIYLTGGATAVVGLASFIAACWGTYVGGKMSRWIWLPALSTVIGLVYGFVQSALVSLLIALGLHAVPYSIGVDLALGIGFAQGLVFLYFHLGRADFIHR